MTCAITEEARISQKCKRVHLHAEPMFTHDELEESDKICLEAREAFDTASKNLTFETLIHEHESRLEH